MARAGRLGKVHTVYADIRYRGGSRHDWLPETTAAAQGGTGLGCLAWPVSLASPYNATYVNHGWYNFHDFATDVAMWGAHTLAQALAGIDMENVSTIEFEYAGPDATIVTRLSNGVKLVLVRVDGSCWDPCQYWHGACGERFDGPEGWDRSGGRLFDHRCFQTVVAARIQEGVERIHGPDAAANETT